MSARGAPATDARRPADQARQLTCQICGAANYADADFCHSCRAPLVLAHEAQWRRTAPRFLAVTGTPGCGKTVYLGMLTDLLSRYGGPLQFLLRGAYSVSLQQEAMAALARRRFPEPTPPDPERWNWVHCDVLGRPRKRCREFVMPDISGEALRQEIESPHSVPLVRAFLSRCSAAILLVDAEAVDRGDADQDYWAVRLITSLTEMQRPRRMAWSRRPLAVVFTKADASAACGDEPEKFARERTPGLWHQCRERLRRHRFFAASVVGASAAVEVLGEMVRVPLRIEPHGIAEPFLWLVNEMGD